MSLARLENYLREHNVDFNTILHAPAYTAQEVAASAHISGWDVAKVVMVKLDDQLAMAVVPAAERVHLGRLRQLAGAKEVRIADESEFSDRFPDCELGAMPPFANLFGLPLFVSEHLAEDKSIAFNAGTHSELIHLAWKDFVELEHPKIADITRH